MNTKAILAAAVLFAAAGSTFAADSYEAAYDQAILSNKTTSTLTREQVKAEVIAARQAGTLEINDAYPDASLAMPRAKNAEVKAQLAAKQAKDSATR